MTPLPFDFVRLGSMRGTVLLRLLLIPFVLIFAACGCVEVAGLRSPTVPYLVDIGRWLATPPDKVQEFVGMMVFLVAGVLGYVLGWTTNSILLVISRKYSAHDIGELIFTAQLPPSWQSEDAQNRVQAAIVKDAAEWQSALEMGPFRYIVVRGGLVFGSIAFLALHVVLNLAMSQPIEPVSLPAKFALWVLFGMVVTAPRWVALKYAHRNKAAKKSPRA